MTDDKPDSEIESRRRMFVALDIPPEAQSELACLRTTLEPEKLFRGRWTQQENLHVTLKFLGEIGPAAVDDVRDKLRRLTFAPFSAHLDRAGVFDSHRRIRIVWIHVAGDGVMRLQRSVDEMLADRFPLEQRFMSHLTIARVQSTPDRRRLIQRLEAVSLSREPFIIAAFHLKESRLSPAGPRYSTVESYSASPMPGAER